MGNQHLPKKTNSTNSSPEILPEILPVEFIQKKRDRKTHTAAEIQNFVSALTNGEFRDEQASAWLMAAFLNGLDRKETLALTEAMLASGDRFDFSNFELPRSDKHSTGGVGDKTSLIIAAIVSGEGVWVPMISGRGLGHTGGTLDKLESIPGFNTQISKVEALRQLQQIGCVLMGQTKEICPADKKLYALRDSTGSVESIPLITASIMSKKLAESLTSLVFDVKTGSGAFMKTFEEAKKLAHSLIDVGQMKGVRCSALITSMDQPLGSRLGNSLEVEECLEILNRQTKEIDRETEALSLELSAQMLLLSGRFANIEDARKACQKSLDSKKALAQFEKIVVAQGGVLAKLPKAKLHKQVLAKSEGWISSLNSLHIGLALIELKAGRKNQLDQLDSAAGIVLHKKIGDFVRVGDPICTLHAEDANLFSAAEIRFENSLVFEAKNCEDLKMRPLILETISTAIA